MKVEQYHFYFLKDQHFQDYKNYKLFTDYYTNYNNHTKGDRPYYLCIEKKDVCWVIPLSKQVEKYTELYNKEVIQHGKSIKFHFLTLNKKDAVLLIQNAFPIAHENIKNSYEYNNKPMELIDKKEIKEINDKFYAFLRVLSTGYTFFPNQADVLSLEKEIISDVKFKKYTEQLLIENSKFNKPFILDEPLLNLIREYNKNFKVPKTLRNICSDYKKDKLNTVKNPLLQSIGQYLTTQQANAKALERSKVPSIQHEP